MQVTNRWRQLIVALAVWCLATSAAAQITTGTILGNVKDARAASSPARLSSSSANRAARSRCRR